LATRIGICRSLHTFNHYPLWRAFLSELGFDVVLSEPVNRETLDFGARVAPAEVCLPVKAFIGQIARIADAVDALFIPRLVCRRVNRRLFFGCPKAIALPDVVRAIFPRLGGIIELIIDERERPEWQAFRDLAVSLGVSRWRPAWLSACHAAEEALGVTRASGSPLHVFGEEVSPLPTVRGPRTAVVGHSYLLFDRHLGMNVLKHVSDAGAQVVVAFPSAKELSRHESLLVSPPSWYYELELLTATGLSVETGAIDGLLFVSSFACGTAPVTYEMIRRKLVRGKFPMLTLLLDEQTGEAGQRTRIESFVDLLMLKGKR